MSYIKILHYTQVSLFIFAFLLPSVAAKVERKCKIEAGEVKPGFYKPQCDEEGNYKPKQCWHSTGYCWCVDKNGKELPDTRTRGELECGNGGLHT